MRCLECGTELDRLDNRHLLECCGLTVQEYALRHHMPLDLLLHADQVNRPDPVEAYGPGSPHVSERARAVLEGVRMAGLLREEGAYTVVPGEVRRLELLLWDLEQLREYGFQFRQEYEYSDDSHRVIARNRLKIPTRCLRARGERLAPCAPPDPLQVLAVYLAHVGEPQAGYLFLPFPRASDGRWVAEWLQREHGIVLSALPEAEGGDGLLLRTRAREDARALLALLGERLTEIPFARLRFDTGGPRATVVKELVFDAAHFITDHPAKCTNLHGGRYRLQVKLRGRIDPLSGCVVDFGYLKRVTNRLVVERFDHHNLNYADPDLAWRSSTELLCVHIWERLIEYLPGLVGLTLYETPQSWCEYRGPSLERLQSEGPSALLRHFTDRRLGSSCRRRLIADPGPTRLQLVGQR